MAVKYDYDYAGMGRYLRTSTELQAAALAFAASLAEVARQEAPTGPAKRGSQPPGAFRDSIKPEPHATSRGAVGARVTASPPWVEFGRPHRRPYRGAHALARARQRLSAPKRVA